MEFNNYRIYPNLAFTLMYVMNALIYMYAKFGNIQMAHALFNKIQ